MSLILLKYSLYCCGLEYSSLQCLPSMPSNQILLSLCPPSPHYPRLQECRLSPQTGKENNRKCISSLKVWLWLSKSNKFKWESETSPLAHLFMAQVGHFVQSLQDNCTCFFQSTQEGWRTPLVVHWIRLHACNAGALVWSLVGELRSHMPLGMMEKNK